MYLGSYLHFAATFAKGAGMSHPFEQYDRTSILAGLQTAWIGRHLEFLPVVDSTNLYAKNLAMHDAPEGALVIANEQTAGRGRFSRRWFAPAGTSLLLSLIFRPELPPSRIHLVTMACGLAAAHAIEEVTGVGAGLKWPNDVLVDGRKVAGILTEMISTGRRIESLVVGIGINVNLDVNAFQEAASSGRYRDALMQDPSLQSLPAQATSLMLAAGRRISRLELLWRFLERLEHWYGEMKDEEILIAAWSRKMSLFGKPVRVTTLEETFVGRPVAVDQDGALLLELAGGERRRIVAGDIEPE